MKSKTKNSTNKKSKAFAVGSHDGQVFASVPYTQEDLKNALLILSLLVNAIFLILWVLTQLRYDYAYLIALAILQ